MTYRTADENPLISVCETDEFLSRAAKIWSDEERSEFVDYIAAQPDVGDIVPGAGGIRKVRWSRAGAGKRGGVRVIYYFYGDAVPLYLLSIFAKNQKSDLNAEDKKALSEFAKRVKDAIRK